MKTLTTLGLLVALSLFASVSNAKPNENRCHSGPAKAVSIAGTQCATFNYVAESWEGTALVSIAGQPAKEAYSVSSDGTFEPTPNGGGVGTETITIVFLDGSGSFEISCHFEGVPGAAPGILNLHEYGIIGNGTGSYFGISGSVYIHGPYLNPFPMWQETKPIFIGQLEGKVLGLKK